MSDLSEDETTDSNDECLLEPENIQNLNSSILKNKLSKHDSVLSKADDINDSTDDDDSYVTHSTNVELFSQVLKNLECTRTLENTNESIKKDISPSKCVTKKNSSAKNTENITSHDITELLLQGETNINDSSYSNHVEDVADKSGDIPGTSGEYTIPQDGIKITLPGTSLIFNKKKKGQQDIKAILRRKFKANLILIEKVGLLCWLAYGFNLNREINQPEIMGATLSLISSSKYPKNRIDLTYLEKFTSWFKKLFLFEHTVNDANMNKERLLKAVKEKKVSDYKELVLLYVATLRALGLNCRLVISLCPPHRVISDDILCNTDEKSQKSKSKETTKNKKGKTIADTKDSVPKNSPEAMKSAKQEAKKRAAEVLIKTRAGAASKIDGKVLRSSKNKSVDSKEEPAPIRSIRTRASAAALRNDSKALIKCEEENTENAKKTPSTRSVKTRAKTDGKTSKYFKEENSDSEADFQPKPKISVKRKLNNADTASTSNKKIVKLLSSDEEEEESVKSTISEDIWAEVYLESEESWICVSIMNEKVHCVAEIYQKAKKPVLYVVAWNHESRIKDVTRRYCSKWLTITRKQRIDEKWWKETLSYWKEKDSAISKAEDEMFLDKELEQPLPKTVSECKGHPLYVLARHLLKYEALYPPDCVPLGYTASKEAIYSRHCVHTLRSRETWIRQARVVKPKQDAYKIVKALPKYDKLSGTKIKDTPLELFGKWQTTQYEPPEAKNGIVPRNEYGNVDLFQVCMIPKGTVHINLPALNRIARKLNIDCAPAVVGFNFGCMGAVPAFEGFVVCKEYEDTLREAWEVEQLEVAKRTKEKQEKRVYGNWKRLIHGLMIRERLAAKYDFSEVEKPSLNSKRTKHNKGPNKKMKVL